MDEEKVQLKLELGHRANLKEVVSPQGHTHDWVLFCRGPEGGNLQHVFEKVVFTIHPEFPRPKRVVREPPYEVRESGYAGFDCQIEVYFRCNVTPKKLQFKYDLYLKSDERVSVVRCEKLTFKNPSEEFKQQLLRSGAVIIGGSEEESKNVVSAAIPPPMATGNNQFSQLFGEPLTRPAVKTSSQDSVVKKRRGRPKKESKLAPPATPSPAPPAPKQTPTTTQPTPTPKQAPPPTMGVPSTSKSSGSKSIRESSIRETSVRETSIRETAIREIPDQRSDPQSCKESKNSDSKSSTKAAKKDYSTSVRDGEYIGETKASKKEYSSSVRSVEYTDGKTSKKHSSSSGSVRDADFAVETKASRKDYGGLGESSVKPTVTETKAARKEYAGVLPGDRQSHSADKGSSRKRPGEDNEEATKNKKRKTHASPQRQHSKSPAVKHKSKSPVAKHSNKSPVSKHRSKSPVSKHRSKSPEHSASPKRHRSRSPHRRSAEVKEKHQRKEKSDKVDKPRDHKSHSKGQGEKSHNEDRPRSKEDRPRSKEEKPHRKDEKPHHKEEKHRSKEEKPRDKEERPRNKEENLKESREERPRSKEEKPGSKESKSKDKSIERVRLVSEKSYIKGLSRSPEVRLEKVKDTQSQYSGSKSSEGKQKSPERQQHSKHGKHSTDKHKSKESAKTKGAADTHKTTSRGSERKETVQLLLKDNPLFSTGADSDSDWPSHDSSASPEAPTLTQATVVPKSSPPKALPQTFPPAKKAPRKHLSSTNEMSGGSDDDSDSKSGEDSSSQHSDDDNQSSADESVSEGPVVTTPGPDSEQDSDMRDSDSSSGARKKAKVKVCAPRQARTLTMEDSEDESENDSIKKHVSKVVNMSRSPSVSSSPPHTLELKKTAFKKEPLPAPSQALTIEEVQARRAPNGLPLLGLLKLQQALQTMNDRGKLQKIIDLIVHSHGLYNVNETSLNFDLCNMNNEVVTRIQEIIGQNMLGCV